MRAAIFATCLMDNFFPDVGEAMVRILHRLGVETYLPEGQTCCGQPAYNSGYWPEAQAVAQTLLENCEDADYVVTPSGSCAGMIHHDYRRLFASSPAALAKAEALASKTYEFSQFLVRVLGVTDLGAEYPARVTYHPSCHGMRLLGVRDEPELLLRAVRGLELVELPHAQDCCGFGGTFSVKLGEISTAMVDEKADHVLETDAPILVGTDMGCLMNIGGRLRRRGAPVRVMHLAELLWAGMQKGGGVA
ncbi:MAG: (Fe-S)-binding protein [Thermoflavifilum sp.]|nr:(Fe-S)-binding protein [Thermoflavifilum sp.]MCL6513711.1 (Fe-S)-binding protein [Alicyclobacillus sp.]